MVEMKAESVKTLASMLVPASGEVERELPADSGFLEALDEAKDRRHEPVERSPAVEDRRVDDAVEDRRVDDMEEDGRVGVVADASADEQRQDVAPESESDQQSGEQSEGQGDQAIAAEQDGGNADGGQSGGQEGNNGSGSAQAATAEAQAGGQQGGQALLELWSGLQVASGQEGQAGQQQQAGTSEGGSGGVQSNMNTPAGPTVSKATVEVARRGGEAVPSGEVSQDLPETQERQAGDRPVEGPVDAQGDAPGDVQGAGVTRSGDKQTLELPNQLYSADKQQSPSQEGDVFQGQSVLPPVGQAVAHITTLQAENDLQPVLSKTKGSSGPDAAVEALAGSRGGELGGGARVDIQAGAMLNVGQVDKSEGVDQERLVEHVVRVVRASVGRGQWQAQIRLHPPELGRIRLDVNVRQDVLNMRIVAETAEARELISARVDQLRESLQQHGITVDRIDVEPRRAPASDASQSGANDASRQGFGAGGEQQGGGQGFSFTWEGSQGAGDEVGEGRAGELDSEVVQVKVDITV